MENKNSNSIALGIFKGFLLLAFFPFSLIAFTDNPKVSIRNIIIGIIVAISFISLIIAFSG